MYTETENARSVVVRPFARVVAHHISQSEYEKLSTDVEKEANFLTWTALEPMG